MSQKAPASTGVPVITVDGPSGSGKGTLAQLLATHLGWHLLDSGALYRILGLHAMDQQIDPGQGDAVAALAEGLAVRFDGERVWVNEQEVTDRLRTEDAGTAASQIASHPAVRTAIVSLQHGFAKPPGLVADGRDMGTVIFPAAPLKIFLTASAEVRAERRYNQLKNKGLAVSLRALLVAIEERDERDRTRTASPLHPAADALVLDSSDLDIDQVMSVVLGEVKALGLDAR